jgi:lysozyme family protein
MPTLDDLRDEYARLWASVEIRPDRDGQARRAATKVLAGRAHYEAVGGALGVPWYFIGLAHMRESYCNFGTHLHNGDSLSARTYHVPAGRPAKGSPPFGWDESAIDALRIKGLQNVREWPIERVCYELERFNGFGYRHPNRGLSPYLWADTNHYQAGKFVSDGKYSSTAVDRQDGCMAVLKIMADLDPAILGGSPETEEAVVAPKAIEAEALSTEAHFEIHDRLKMDSWLYWANRMNIKTITASCAGAMAFLQDHMLEIGGIAVAAVIIFELAQYAQRCREGATQ